MPALSPVFADGSTINIPTAAAMTVLVAFLLAGFKFVTWLLEQRRLRKAEDVAPEVCHWADATGEQRPVTAQECGARMSGLDATIREVRDTLVKMEAQLGDGVELRMRKVAEVASDKAVDLHEVARHDGKRR
jgi:preprotein translocase subunit YajC